MPCGVCTSSDTLFSISTSFSIKGFEFSFIDNGDTTGAGDGADFGVDTIPTLVPHLVQNFIPADNVLPHFEQTCVLGASICTGCASLNLKPHLVQNLALSLTSY
jgi:hypothetical protein